MARRAAAHTLELVPERRGGRAGSRTERRQSVDVTLCASDRMLLTVEEAADRLGIGRSTMYQLIAGGLVDTVRVGRLRRVEPEALAAYVARLRRAPHPAAWRRGPEARVTDRSTSTWCGCPRDQSMIVQPPPSNAVTTERQPTEASKPVFERALSGLVYVRSVTSS
jgi:excisionase family DNA binding protein